ncbi:BglG family transcription antiterminator [Candidatus Enterococcus ikei]|uniref:Ascorbate-specific PTS system EIIA component n=1 Tax=Candidatus Enterococcus ikei TaxID=2815326 RepID=A0ABS3H2X3_9ENTE|nr:BglG family transcription antiterminator [Enterococcus sp. DIV0869a]MBO0441870.1 BglG family transcription antiterminator [Enterococcus sp. DIV0869a]
MIDYRMSYLINGPHSVGYAIQEINEITGLPTETVIDQLGKLNEQLQQFSYEPIYWEKDRIYFSKQVADKWLELYFGKLETDIVYSEDERQALLYLLTFIAEEDLSVYHYQEFLQVSKNTILADIKKLRKHLAKQQISLDYSRKNGFYLSGCEGAIRIQAHQMIAKIVSSVSGKWGLKKGLIKYSKTFEADVRSHLFEAIKASELVIVPSRIEETIYFMAYVLKRAKGYSFRLDRQAKDTLKELNAFNGSQLFLAKFPEILDPENEQFYFTLIFMTITQGEIRDTALEFLLECASQIIHEMERLAAIEFKAYRKLLLDLFYHLVPAFFRIKYHFSLANVLTEEIKEQYGELFALTKIALHPLELLIGQPIPDEEVGYFTILFGGEIGNQRELNRVIRYKALVLCPSGISSSLIIQSELKELFPTIDFSLTTTVDQLESIAESDYDVIFSSVPLTTPKKMYLVNPIMSQLEKNNLIRCVQEDLLIPGIIVPSIDEIIETLLPYIDLKKGVTKEKIYRILNRKMIKKLKAKEDEKPMLSELLTTDMIQLTDKKLNWEEAIAYAAQPLKTQGKITEDYIEAMIQKVKDYGAFIHIGKGIALPHARPEDGVKQLGMSLLKIEEPVLLLDDPKHEITIFICLAAVDNEMHLKALASLTKILSNKENLEKLLAANDQETIIQLLKEGESL